MKNTIEDGGPAFPQTISVGNLMWIEGGLTLRDYFAGQALAGILANPDTAKASSMYKRGGWIDAELLAGNCYEQADAMIAERNRKDG